jgi:peptide/nickel transport system permease protein
LLRYVLSRLAASVLLLFTAATIAFVVFHLLPGDPASALAGVNAPPSEVQAIRVEYHLNQSLITQYGEYLDNLAHFNLGRSIEQFGIPVSTLFAQRIPVTLQLIATSLIVALFFTALFSWSSLRPGGRFDKFVGRWCVLGLAIPSFWFGFMLVLVFAVHLRWLPASGYVSVFQSPIESIRYAILPSVTYGFVMSAVFILVARRSLGDVFREDYIRTARAKGLREWTVVRRHAAKSAMIPFVTIVGVTVAGSLAGAVLIESVFNYPGFGQLFLQGVSGRDYYVVESGLLVIMGAMILANFVVDLIYLALDPRISYR